MQYAPIALFTYNRLQHLRQAVESLKENELAKESPLFIFSDAPRDKKSEFEVKAVRDYLGAIDGFKKVMIYNREDNFTPSKNIIEGVSQVLNECGKVIVLEDDLCVSKYFLNFMNEALLFYENELKVISICGYMYPVKIKNCETLFLRIPDCWGWATWKRGWDLFEPDANKLLGQIKSRKLSEKFNLNGRYDFLGILKKQAENRISSWAVRWYAVSLLNDKLSLYPAESLVRNIGFDDSGTHCGYGAEYDVEVFQKRVIVSEIPLAEDRHAIKKVGVFFRIKQLKKIGFAIRNLVISLIQKYR